MDVDEAHAQFARMLVEHEPVFMRYVLTKVPNRADARDIVQECSVALWREFPNTIPIAHLSPGRWDSCASKFFGFFGNRIVVLN